MATEPIGQGRPFALVQNCTLGRASRLGGTVAATRDSGAAFADANHSWVA
jgi:hypothetical protein